MSKATSSAIVISKDQPTSSNNETVIEDVGQLPLNKRDSFDDPTFKFNQTI